MNKRTAKLKAIGLTPAAIRKIKKSLFAKMDRKFKRELKKIERGDS